MDTTSRSLSLDFQPGLLTTTGFRTILRSVPTLTLRHSRMMLAQVAGWILAFLVLEGHGSAGWFPNWE